MRAPGERDVIVIGGSAGGFAAVNEILRRLPATFPARVAVVLHRSPMFESRLAPLLARSSPIVVREARIGDRLERGVVHVAPRDLHMTIRAGGKIRLDRGPRQNFSRPAIDPLFRSAASVYGRRVAALLLSGCGEDGVSGCIAVKGRGGLIVAQDPEEARYPAMPKNAIIFDHVDVVASLDRIAAILVALAVGGRAVPKDGATKARRARAARR